MSVICEAVRSSGGVTDEVRSTLIDGSISWLRVAAVSQWEIDEPGATGLSAATIISPLTRSVPARIDRSSASVTFTVCVASKPP